MESTRSLLDQLEELANEAITLSNRLACTAEDVRFAQSFHPQSVAAELAASRKILLALSHRLDDVERFLAPASEPASGPTGQAPLFASPQDAVSLRPAAYEESLAEVPSALLGQKWEAAEARLSGLTQLIQKALRAENASDAARNLGDLALEYHRQGKFDEAEGLYRHALAFQEKFLGPEHESVAVILNNLAALLKEQGRLAEAAALLGPSASIPEAGGPHHPETDQSQSNHAGSDLDQEEVTEQELFFDQVLEVMEKNKQATLPEVRAILEKSSEVPEENVPMQRSVEEAAADVSPEPEATAAAPNPPEEQHGNPLDAEQIRLDSEPGPAAAGPPNHPQAPFIIWEPSQRRKPAMPAWAWGVAALAAISICALFVWRSTGRPHQAEVRNAMPAEPPLDLPSAAATETPPIPATTIPSTGTLIFPDLLPGTRVSVDGFPHDLSPDGSFEAALGEGNYNVQLTRPGYEPKSLSVELKAGQTVTIRGKEVTVDSRITGTP